MEYLIKWLNQSNPDNWMKVVRNHYYQFIN